MFVLGSNTPLDGLENMHSLVVITIFSVFIHHVLYLTETVICLPLPYDALVQRMTHSGSIHGQKNNLYIL
jgi:hypothetical protein